MMGKGNSMRNQRNQHEVKYTGIFQKVNQINVDFRASVVITEKKQTIVTIYEVTTDVEKEIRNSKYCYGVIKLDQGGYLCLFDILIEGEEWRESITGEGEKIIRLRLSTSNAIFGEKEFGVAETFDELQIEITEGCELIGLCPYNVNENYVKLMKAEEVEIPIDYAPIVASTILGEFQFSCIPSTKFSKNELKLEMRHYIFYRSRNMLEKENIRLLLEGNRTVHTICYRGYIGSLQNHKKVA